jgi:murein DD-endopeptidase MepM/ murein hydrolase activator NlpD
VRKPAQPSKETRVSPAHQYKRLENEIVNTLEKRLRLRWQALLAFFRRIYQKGRQRFTVMFIPHSEKRIFNFQISVFTLIFVISLMAVVLAGFIVLATHFTGTNDRYVKISRSLNASESSLESYKDEIIELRKVSKDFKGKMEEVLSVVGTEDAANYMEKGVGGELSNLVSLEDLNDGNLRDLSDLRGLRTYLGNSVGPLSEIYKLLQAQRALLVDIPSLWPLKGARGNITNDFGFSRNPFTGMAYVHKGIDIAWGYGTPIVATANGKVLKVDNDPLGLGLSLVLRHNYGFHTRYGHLDRVVVQKGQEIRRGQVIGYMGNSGLSTGPHLHYEVGIGTNVVDPKQFLSIRSPLIETK